MPVLISRSLAPYEMHERTNQSMILMIIVFSFAIVWQKASKTVEQVWCLNERKRSQSNDTFPFDCNCERISSSAFVCFRKDSSRSEDESNLSAIRCAWSEPSLSSAFAKCLQDQAQLELKFMQQQSHPQDRRKKIWQVVCQRFQSSTQQHIHCIMFQWTWSYHNFFSLQSIRQMDCSNSLWPSLADAIGRKRQSRSTTSSSSFFFAANLFRLPKSTRNEIIGKLFVRNQKNKPSDCFRVIFMGLFMSDDGYSIPSLHSCLEISHQLSDYISHSMKLLACFPRLKISFENNRERERKSDSVACIMIFFWSSKNDERPPVSLNYLLETNLVIVDKIKGNEEEEDNYLFLCKQWVVPTNICLEDNHRWGTSLHNRRHSSSLNKPESIDMKSKWSSDSLGRLLSFHLTGQCISFDWNKKIMKNMSCFFHLILRWLIISFKRIRSHLLVRLEKKPWSERRQRLTNYSFLSRSRPCSSNDLARHYSSWLQRTQGKEVHYSRRLSFLWRIDYVNRLCNQREGERKSRTLPVLDASWLFLNEIHISLEDYVCIGMPVHRWLSDDTGMFPSWNCFHTDRRTVSTYFSLQSICFVQVAREIILFQVLRDSAIIVLLPFPVSFNQFSHLVHVR